MKTSHLDYILLFLFTAFSIDFFSPVIIAHTPFEHLRYFAALIAIIISLPFILSSHFGGLQQGIKLIFIAQILSIFSAYYFWHQSIIDCISASLLLMYWPLFFYLNRYKIAIRSIESIIIIFACIYIILFLFQYTHNGTVYFGNKDEFNLERGVVRINFPGAGPFFLAYFISIVKITEEKRNKLFWICFSIVCIIVTVMQVTRQNLIFNFLIFFYHMLRRINYSLKVIFFCLFFIVFTIILNSDNKIVNGLTQTSETDLAQGENYIRVLSAGYFLFNFSPNTYCRIMGNGAPYKSEQKNSVYGDYVLSLQQTDGFYLSDDGLIGFYTMFGILGVFAFLKLFVQSIKIKIPKRFIYLKYYLFFLIITSITSANIYDTNFLITNVFVFYGFQFFHEEYQSEG